MVEACATCQRHRPQEPRQPLQPRPAPERPWQHLGADFMMFDGNEYLILVDYYSKMQIVWKMPASQCNAVKTIATLKEIFGEHGIPEIIRQLTMDHNSVVTSLQSSHRNGTLTMSSVLHEIQEAMDKLNLQ